MFYSLICEASTGDCGSMKERVWPFYACTGLQNQSGMCIIAINENIPGGLKSLNAALWPKHQVFSYIKEALYVFVFSKLKHNWNRPHQTKNTIWPNDNGHPSLEMVCLSMGEAKVRFAYSLYCTLHISQVADEENLFHNQQL